MGGVLTESWSRIHILAKKIEMFILYNPFPINREAFQAICFLCFKLVLLQKKAYQNQQKTPTLMPFEF